MNLLLATSASETEGLYGYFLCMHTRKGIGRKETINSLCSHGELEYTYRYDNTVQYTLSRGLSKKNMSQ